MTSCIQKLEKREMAAVSGGGSKALGVGVGLIVAGTTGLAVGLFCPPLGVAAAMAVNGLAGYAIGRLWPTSH
jgi:hypothetical protein